LQQHPGMSGPGSAALYEIRVEGVLGLQRAAWLENLQIENDGRQTIISGSVTDQAALHGLLAKRRLVMTADPYSTFVPADRC
jgi:hypothetical protein